MNNLKTLLNSDVKKLIIEKNPVIKKRPAKWFFMDELKSNLEHEKAIEEAKKDNLSPRPSRIKFKKSHLEDVWKNMQPESKRKFFNMAKLDELRFKEQKSLWVAEVASLITKYAKQKNNFAEFIPSLDKIQREFEKNFQKNPKNCEHILDLETTKQIYRNVIVESREASTQSLETEEMILSVPDDYRPLLSKPRRPITPFLLFVRVNKPRLVDLHLSKYPELSLKKVSGNEWANLSPEERGRYEQEYSCLMKEYKKAMAEYELANPNLSKTSLGMAFREKKAFSRTLRKRLREFEIVPVNVRNAFNFFVSENKDKNLTEIKELWINLNPERRAEYERKMQEDVKRYHAERIAYEELIKDLLDLLKL